MRKVLCFDLILVFTSDTTGVLLQHSRICYVCSSLKVDLDLTTDPLHVDLSDTSQQVIWPVGQRQVDLITSMIAGMHSATPR